MTGPRVQFDGDLCDAWLEALADLLLLENTEPPPPAPAAADKLPGAEVTTMLSRREGLFIVREAVAAAEKGASSSIALAFCWIVSSTATIRRSCTTSWVRRQ